MEVKAIGYFILFVVIIALFVRLMIKKLNTKALNESSLKIFEEQNQNVKIAVEAVPDYAYKNRSMLQGTVGNIPVYVAYVSDRKVDSTNISAHIPAALPYGLTITKSETKLERQLGHILMEGEEDIETGYPELDERVSVQCPSRVEMHILLADAGLRRAIAEAFATEPSITIARNEVVIETSRAAVNSDDALRRMLLFAYGVANAFAVVQHSAMHQIQSFERLQADSQGGLT